MIAHACVSVARQANRLRLWHSSLNGLLDHSPDDLCYERVLADWRSRTEPSKSSRQPLVKTPSTLIKQSSNKENEPSSRMRQTSLTKLQSREITSNGPPSDCPTKKAQTQKNAHLVQIDVDSLLDSFKFKLMEVPTQEATREPLQECQPPLEKPEVSSAAKEEPKVEETIAEMVVSSIDQNLYL